MRQLLAGMIAEPAFLSEYTIFALDSSKEPKPQSGRVVSPPAAFRIPFGGMQHLPPVTHLLAKHLQCVFANNTFLRNQRVNCWTLMAVVLPRSFLTAMK